MAKQDAILKEKEQEREEKVIETVSKTDQFFRENKKTIYGILIALVVIALVLVAYQKFYVQPKSDEATAQMIPAEANFRNGEFELALNGDGNVLGFAQIIEDFGAKEARMYISTPESASSSSETIVQPSTISRSTTARTRFSPPAPQRASVTPT